MSPTLTVPRHQRPRLDVHSHDPFRGGGRAVPVARIADVPHDGPVTILAYVDRYPPMINAGAESMLHALLRDSVRRGHRVMVATGCVRQPTTVEGVEVYPASNAVRLSKLADVMVTHLLWTNEAIRAASGAGLPLLYIVHNDSQIRFWRLSESKVSAYLWNSEWVAAKCGEWPEAAGIPSVVVRPPLVADRFTVRSPAPADRRFVTLVNPIEAKGAAVFFRLAETERRRSFLAVEGAYGTQRRPQSRHRNVEWQAQTGNMRDDVFARTRVLYVGSSYESWGLAAVEACAAGVPVIATPTPGLVEALGEDWPYFVPFGDLRAARVALAALDNPDTYEAASAAALARAGVLDALGRADLDRWDRLARMGAKATIDLRGGTGTTGEGPESVPELAATVVAWIRAAETPEAVAERAGRAWAVEKARPGGIRKTVAEVARHAHV